MKDNTILLIAERGFCKIEKLCKDLSEFNLEKNRLLNLDFMVKNLYNNDWTLKNSKGELIVVNGLNLWE